MNNKRIIAIAASALAAFASIGLITNQASASSTTPVTSPAVSPETGSNTPDVAGALDDIDVLDVQSGDQDAPDVAGAPDDTDSDTEGDASDGDDVQSGDQDTPDVAGATDEG